ncbi:tumor necrosis factor receptor superfamily member 4 [Anabas testudineus]|nr:tumor necrosis factor receptor superfamily member 4 [Anabas testudineus]
MKSGHIPTAFCPRTEEGLMGKPDKEWWFRLHFEPMHKGCGDSSVGRSESATVGSSLTGNAQWYLSMMNMHLSKVLLFTLTFCKLAIHSDATRCLKGQRVTRQGGCTACSNGYYQPEENDSQECRPCTNCNKNWGSSVKQECTRETDRKCQCRAGFTPWEDDASSCKCDIGFGLKNNECLECEYGYFTSEINSVCQKWKECKSGVKVNGKRTSDAICNDPESDSAITKTIIQSTSLRPREEPQTQATRTMTFSTAPPQHKGTPKKEEAQNPHSNAGHYTGMVLLIFGIIGLLILTAVTCKLHITPCMQKKTAVQTKDSCRRPVEESGDGSLSSFKLNPEEP